MTISSTTRIAGPFTGNGVTTVFPFAYKVFSTADVQVIRLTISTGAETTLTIVTDYTVTLNSDQDSNPGGNVTLLVALAAIYKLTLTSDIANLQPTDLTNQGGFYPEVITDALDRATIQIQQISDIGDRTLKIPISDGALNMELPTAASRANSFLAFGATGLPTVVTAGSSGAPTTMTRQNFSGTGAQVAFTLASDPGALGNSAEVFIGGVYQNRTTYTISGLTLTFSAAPVLGTDNIEFVNFLTDAIGSTSADLVTYTPAGTGAVARSAQNKFRDTVSVKDFGAVGDGTTDDSATIQLALNSGASKITFPAGSYLINTRIQCAQSNIEVDFGSALLINTIALPVVVVYSYNTNAMFDFTGSSVRISGGTFKNGLSECIRITGVFVGGNTFTGAGFTSDHRVSDVIFENCVGNACNIRFFYNSTMSNIVVRDKGAGAAGHEPELGFSYGTGASISNCQVRSSLNGGAAYFLYVDSFSCAGCGFTSISNPTSPQSVAAIYASNSSNGSASGNSVSVVGGVGLKYSYGCVNMSACSNIISVIGTAAGDQYAAVFLQGVDRFVIDGNHLSNVGNHVIRLSNHVAPTNLNTKNGVVSNNQCVTTYGGGIATRTYDGDGIYAGSLTTEPRGPIDIVGNRLVTGNLYSLQSKNSRISNNMLLNEDLTNAYLPTSGALFIDRCTKSLVESNHVVDETTAGSRYGIRLNSCGQTFVYDNVVQYDSGGGVAATAFFQDGTPAQNRWIENIPLNAGTTYSGIGGTQAQQTQVLYSTDTFNMSNVPAGDTITFTRTLTGALLSDMVLITAQGGTGTPQSFLILTAYVTAADTITVIASNNTGSAIDLASQAYNILLIKQASY